MSDKTTATKLEKALAVIAALPCCAVCATNGVTRKATRSKSVGFGRWYLCDQHGHGYGDVLWGSALREYEKE